MSTILREVKEEYRVAFVDSVPCLVLAEEEMLERAYSETSYLEAQKILHATCGWYSEDSRQLYHQFIRSYNSHGGIKNTLGFYGGF